METSAQSQPLYQYRCFDRSFKLELALFVLVIPTILTMWVFAAYYYGYSGLISYPLVRAAAYFTITFLFVRIFYGNFRSAAGARSVVLDGDRVAKKSADVVNVFNYAGISKIRRPKIPFTYRWIVLESPKKIFSVPVYVRGGHEMVERIFRNLEEKGLFLEGLAGLKNKFYKSSMRFNTKYDLRAAHMPKVVRAAAAAALLNGFTAMFFWECSLLTSMLWAYLNLLLQMEAYFLAERFYVAKVLKGKSADGGSFASFYAVLALLALLAGMAFGMCVDWYGLQYEYLG
jgi:hypothetical protein